MKPDFTDPNETAYPATQYFDEKAYDQTQGLTKREYYAGIAMKGLCVGKLTADIKNGKCVDIAECAIEIADQLIKALNRK
jgi:hypothetical protein